MSQGGANSLPHSRPSSRSSQNLTSPENSHPGAAIGAAPNLRRSDSASGASDPTERRSYGARSRSTIGDVLNPTAQEHVHYEQRQTPADVQFGGQGLEPAPRPTPGALPATASRGQYQSSGAEQQIGRGVPPLMPDGSRRILTPRGPRAASASSAHSQFTGSPRMAVGITEMLTNQPRPSQLPPLSSAGSLPGTPVHTAPQPVRTNSQPFLASMHPAASSPYSTTAPRRPWPTPGQPPQPSSISEFPAGVPRSMSSSGVASPGALQMLLRNQQSTTSAEGNPVITGRLANGVPIPVELELKKGSSVQSQKRSRNAEASGRHRSKRKAQTTEMQKEIETLKEEREEAQRRIEELARERDFYREERDRLRDVISREPHIAHLAPGPSSPRAPVHHATTHGDRTIAEDPSMAHERQTQGYPLTISGRGGQPEALARSSDSRAYVQTYSSGYSRPALTLEPSQNPPGIMPPTEIDSRHSGAAPAAAATQLPRIGTMSSLPNPAGQGQSWGQDRQQDPRTQSQSRPNPGWATDASGSVPDAPAR